MTLRFSTGARNALVGNLGFSGAFNKGTINIYSGTQPATADSAVTGTLLGTVTVGSGALTQETRATGTITITGGSTSILTVLLGTVNIIPDGAVPYNTSVSQTAADLCVAINRNGMLTATVAGAVVTVSPRPGAGASLNGLALSSTGSVTATFAALSGGVSAVAGLNFGQEASGVLGKPSTQTWSFNGLAVGTAGWFRFVASAADAGAAISAAPWLARIDGSVAVSGADLNVSNVSITVAAPTTIDSFTLTAPAA